MITKLTHISKYYDRDKVRQLCIGKTASLLRPCLAERIEADRKHALNYIIQSTTADLVLRQVIKVHKMLQGMQTHIAFTIHDNIVLDMPYEERYNIPMLVEKFSNTAFGEFLVNVKAGKDFGRFEDIKSMNIIGLGKAGCAIADDFARYPQYTIFKIDVDMVGEKCYNVQAQSGPEEYEASAPSFEEFFKGVSGDTILVVGGSGDISGLSLRIMEQNPPNM